MQAETIELSPTVHLSYYPTFYSPTDADNIYCALSNELCFEQRSIVMFGKVVMQPRLIAWAGSHDYRYSGRSLEPREPTQTSRELMQHVNETLGTRCNHMLANLYRDGNDSMGMHADDEPELGTDPLVITVSFGAPRKLSIRTKPSVYKLQGESIKRQLELTHGSLLVMPGSFQQTFHHAIPKSRKCVTPRLSVTLREIVARAASQTAKT